MAADFYRHTKASAAAAPREACGAPLTCEGILQALRSAEPETRKKIGAHIARVAALYANFFNKCTYCKPCTAIAPNPEKSANTVQNRAPPDETAEEKKNLTPKREILVRPQELESWTL